jgi:hypothetical protein
VAPLVAAWAGKTICPIIGRVHLSGSTEIPASTPALMAILRMALRRP